MASLTMNGTSLSPSNLSIDDSEESFVVLSRHGSSETPDQMLDSSNSLISNTTMITLPSMPRQQFQTTDENTLIISATSVSSTSTNELSAEEIQSKLESLLQENLQLKETLNQNNLAMKKQFSTLVMWQEDVMKVHQSHKEKFEETKKLIANLRSENAELKKAHSLPPTISTTQSDDALNLKSKISALEFELDTLRQANIKYKSEQSKLVQDLEAKVVELETTKHEQISALQTEINSLSTQLKNIADQYNESQGKLEEVSRKVPTQAELEAVESLKTQCKELANELLLKSKVLKEKTDLIDNLHEEISKLKIDNETIPILTTQVELYQTDFNQEREARNVLKQEKDRASEDLRHLQRRNQQLLEEVERLRERDGHFVHISSATPSAPTSSRTSPNREGQRFTCPKCGFAFFDYQALENHVYRCLEDM